MPPISFIVAFLGGLLTAFSPCVLPLIPAYISYISDVFVEELMQDGSNKWKIRKKLLLNAVFFSAGFSCIFVLLGASATLVGKFLLVHLQILSKIAGIAIIFLGLYFVGLLKLFKIKFLHYEKRFQFQKKSIGVGWSFLAGMAFSFGWTPCVGPILAGILAYAATQETLNQGILLLSLFSLGMSIPIIATVFFIDLFRKLSFATSILRHFEIISGILLIVFGVLIFTNDLQAWAGIITSKFAGAMRWIQIFEEKLLHFN
jgi:cytochrome c-type biogenesis protein